MRNIDGSQWMKDPSLEVIQSKSGSSFGSSFTLDAQETSGDADTGADGPQAGPRGRVVASAGRP